MEASTDPLDLTRPVRSPTNGDLQFHIDIIDKCNLQCPTCFCLVRIMWGSTMTVKTVLAARQPTGLPALPIREVELKNPRNDP
jgi:hypothetical protein